MDGEGVRKANWPVVPTMLTPINYSWDPQRSRIRRSPPQEKNKIKAYFIFTGRRFPTKNNKEPLMELLRFFEKKK